MGFYISTTPMKLGPHLRDMEGTVHRGCCVHSPVPEPSKKKIHIEFMDEDGGRTRIIKYMTDEEDADERMQQMARILGKVETSTTDTGKRKRDEPQLRRSLLQHMLVKRTISVTQEDLQRMADRFAVQNR
jgi:hypothetical protein